ncbi:MAG TPA: hypothetical protein VKA19_00525, partial [Alphaproteobacteria bacterium]|nr:hypothetical protein [Alphaproteobacteria bacterium]
EGPPELETTIGGALRFNLFYKSWDRPATVRSSGNDVAFDTFRIDVESSYGPLSLSAEYRFYAGYNMLHHGWLAYRLLDVADLKLGLVRVPFGPLPYASNNYFFSLGYYVGLEDDYDIGGRADFDLGLLDAQIAYFHNDEGSYSGSSIDSARYSYDLVRSDGSEIPAIGPDATRTSEEQSQVNARVTVTGEHGELGQTEVGLSGEWGEIKSGETDARGDHWAVAAHVRGRYGPVGLIFEAARYGYDPAAGTGQDESWVVMGAFDAPYRVASEAYLFVGSVSYRFALDRGPLESLTLYEEYSRLAKLEDGYADTQQNVTGALLAVGPLYVYLDVALGKNHPWIGPSYVDALAEGAADPDWEARINANIGYYF